MATYIWLPGDPSIDRIAVLLIILVILQIADLLQGRK